MQAVSDGASAGEEQGGGGSDLTAVRRALLLAIWLPFTAYAFGPWSPGATGDPKDIELVTHLCEFFFFFCFGVFPQNNAVRVPRVCRFNGPVGPPPRPAAGRG